MTYAYAGWNAATYITGEVDADYLAHIEALRGKKVANSQTELDTEQVTELRSRVEHDPLGVQDGAAAAAQQRDRQGYHATRAESHDLHRNRADQQLASRPAERQGRLQQAGRQDHRFRRRRRTALCGGGSRGIAG